MTEKLSITSSQLTGEISLPSSKSHTLRAILFAAMASGISTIYDHLPSPDTLAAIEACRSFGALVTFKKNSLEIVGINQIVNYTENVIQAGNSGIVARFFCALGALGQHPVVITGDHSIRHLRPMEPLLNGLKQLGVKTQSMRGDNLPPIIIQGPLQPGQALLDGADSQPVSALLIAAAFVKGKTKLTILNPGEKPWIGLTLDWFDRLGILYKNDNYHSYEISGHASYKGFEYYVPGDLSSAAFPLVAALITNSTLTLSNIDMDDVQGDKKIISILEKMGARIQINKDEKKLFISPGTSLNGIKIDLNDMIDAITILAVLGCYAEGTTHLYNGKIARHKECDRIQSIAHELRKMGAVIDETEDGLIIKKSPLKGALVDSHNDHRMALSLAIAGLGAKGETTVDSFQCVTKTFPDFIQQFQRLGAHFKEIS